MYTLGSLTASNYQLKAQPYGEISPFCATAAHFQMDNHPLHLRVFYLYFNSQIYETTRSFSETKHTFISHFKYHLNFCWYWMIIKFAGTIVLFSYTYMDQQIQHWHIMNDCYSKHCCHCNMLADAKTQPRCHVSHLNLRGGVLLLPCHPGQRIFLALSRIPPHEEKVLGQRKSYK